ncbi:unnamed protein product, partial [Rotaria sp. Silwood2]
MAIERRDTNSGVHNIGAIGTFGCFLLYCILHTTLIIYLFIRRSQASEYSTIVLPLWYLGCTIISIISSITIAVTYASIPEYIASGTSFLYFLAFVPQFWMRAKTVRKTTDITSH